MPIPPFEIEEARYGEGEDPEELEQRWLAILERAERIGVDIELHPLNRRALELYPIFFNRATADFPAFGDILFDVTPIPHEEGEDEYLVRACMRIYSVSQEIYDKRREAEQQKHKNK